MGEGGGTARRLLVLDICMRLEMEMTGAFLYVGGGRFGVTIRARALCRSLSAVVQRGVYCSPTARLAAGFYFKSEVFCRHARYMPRLSIS